ncbi:MAG: transposase [Nitrospira sp.]
MQRKITISLGEYYHIYNRGVEKRKVFESKSNYERFLKLLYLANGSSPFRYDEVKRIPLNKIDRGGELVSIGAYVLMPNHFHILVKETTEGGVAKFMEKLTTGYSGYFNKLNSRVGSLFQGTYKAEHADNDEYLKYLFSYIHLNPVKLVEHGWRENGIKDIFSAKRFLNQYRYSSYQDYIGVDREESLILNEKDFPDYFSENFSFDEVSEWLLFNKSQ